MDWDVITALADVGHAVGATKTLRCEAYFSDFFFLKEIFVVRKVRTRGQDL